MRRFFNNAVVGGAIGAALVITVLVLLSAFVTRQSLDTISVDLLVPAYVLLATLILANTDNSIDSRVRATLDRYEKDYKAEIAQDRKERTEAMEKSAEIMQTQVLPQVQVMQHKNQAFVTRVLVLCGLFVLSQFVADKRVRTWVYKRLSRRP